MSAPGPTSAGLGRLRHVPALDGLRGAAVVAVLLFHHDELLPGGYLGVDAFFVLSGFLITRLLLHEVAATGRLDLPGFWGRRFRRLLPAMVATLTGVAAYAAVFAQPAELARIRGDAVAALAYVANWRAIAGGQDYWAIFQAPSPLEHMWSLAIEEQFYLAWPLVVAVIAWLVGRGLGAERRADRVARVVLVGSLVGSLAGSAWMAHLFEPGSDADRAYLGTDTRAPAILLGGALAAWVTWRGQRGRRWGLGRTALEVAGGTAALLLAAAWVTVELTTSRLYEGGFLVLGIATAAVIAAVAHPVEGPLARMLSWTPLRWAGLVSYGLYLWHWPIYVVLTEERTGLDGAALLALRLAVSVSAAGVSYLAVEAPVRTGRLRRLRLPVAVPAAVAVCAALVLIATIPPAGRTRSIAVTPAGARIGDEAAGPRPDLLVAGDSVAHSIASGAAVVAGAVRVTNAGVNGCVLTEEITGIQFVKADGSFEDTSLNPACVPRWKQAFEAVRPSIVSIIFGNAVGFERFRLHGEWVGPCDRPYRSWYEARLGDVVRWFQTRGAVVTVATVPYHVAAGLPEDHRERIDCMSALNRSVASRVGDVAVLDLAGFVCPAGRCVLDHEGAVLRPDGIHFGEPVAGDPANGFEGPGAEHAGRWLAESLATLAPPLSSAGPRREPLPPAAPATRR